MAYEALVNAVNGLPDEKVNELIDYALFLKSNIVRPMAVTGDIQSSGNKDDMRGRNLTILSEIMDHQAKEDEDYVTEKVIDNTLNVVFHLVRQPEIFKTGRNSIHLQFELPDRSYMELEVFEERITCMIVPKREYKDVVYPKIKLGDMRSINKIVGDFYGSF